jgi:hypothetical protein
MQVALRDPGLHGDEMSTNTVPVDAYRGAAAQVVFD